MPCWLMVVFFFQAEDGIRDLVRSRGLGDVYKRQNLARLEPAFLAANQCLDCGLVRLRQFPGGPMLFAVSYTHLTLPTSDLV